MKRAKRAGPKVLAAAATVIAAVPLAAGPSAAVTLCNATPITIPVVESELPQPAAPYPSTIDVTGLSGSVTDVNLVLRDFSLVEPEGLSAYSSDIDVMLVGPTGVAIIPFSDLGDDNAGPPPPIPPTAPLSFTIDDSAASTLPADAPLSVGTFRPTNDSDVGEVFPTDQFPAPAPSSPNGTALSTFNGNPPNGTWSLYVVGDFFGEETAQFAGGWCLEITAGGSSGTTTSTSPTTTTTAPPADDVAPPADFDGDGDTDVSVFRPSGLWFVNGGATSPFGTTGDVPVPGDYDGDGDGDTDMAVFRPSNGIWFVQGGPTVAWGTSGDIPVPGDYDGDGDTDMAVFRPSNGIWFVQGGPTVAWGTSGDIPVPGDYDGDGDTDIAVFRPSNGIWFVNGGPTVAWGTSGDIPVPGDYDGDGDTDIAVFRPSSGIWFVNGGPTVAWGTSGDIPVPGDYDGDGDTDIAVFRPSNGIWFVQAGPTVAWGTSGDVPLPLPDAIRRFFFPPL